MTDLTDLIARVEAGKGADRDTDWHIAKALGVGITSWEDIGIWPPFMKGSKADKAIPTYNASIDAVLTLMPPECFWQLGHDGDGPNPSKFKARVFDPMKMRGPCISVTVDPVRALLAAILRAKEAGHA